MGYFIPINPPFISRFSITNPLIHPNFPIDPFLTFRPKRDISAFPAFSGQVLRFKRCRATVNAPPVVDSEVFRAALATASWPSSQNVDPKNGIENGGVPKGTPKKLIVEVCFSLCWSFVISKSMCYGDVMDLAHLCWGLFFCCMTRKVPCFFLLRMLHRICCTIAVCLCIELALRCSMDLSGLLIVFTTDGSTRPLCLFHLGYLSLQASLWRLEKNLETSFSTHTYDMYI